MRPENFIPLTQLCTHYHVEVSFFHHLKEYGLIEVHGVEQDFYVHQDQVVNLEKMIRLHHELHINLEGIDAVLNLLAKIDALKQELEEAKNRLRLYEE